MSKFHRNKKKAQDTKDKRIIFILAIAAVIIVALLSTM